jgi:hypothetical protein
MLSYGKLARENVVTELEYDAVRDSIATLIEKS